MPQITIYLDDDTSSRLRAAAQAEGIPVSRWISRLIRDRTRTQWPPQVRELAGAWADLPDNAFDQPGGPPGGEPTHDIPREPL